MILLFTLRHHLSYEAITDLLKLLTLLVPGPNKIPKSVWQFRKIIDDSCTKPQRHYYCNECHDNIRDNTASKCTTCQSDLSNTTPGSFTILPIENQIQSLFQSM